MSRAPRSLAWLFFVGVTWAMAFGCGSGPGGATDAAVDAGDAIADLAPRDTDGGTPDGGPVVCYGAGDTCSDTRPCCPPLLTCVAGLRGYSCQ